MSRISDEVYKELWDLSEELARNPACPSQRVERLRFAAQVVRDTDELVRGTFTCPQCGIATPHYHPSPVAGVPVLIDATLPPHLVRLANADGSGVELNLETNAVRSFPPRDAGPFVIRGRPS